MIERDAQLIRDAVWSAAETFGVERAAKCLVAADDAAASAGVIGTFVLRFPCAIAKLSVEGVDHAVG